MPATVGSDYVTRGGQKEKEGDRQRDGWMDGWMGRQTGERGAGGVTERRNREREVRETQREGNVRDREAMKVSDRQRRRQRVMALATEGPR